MWVVFFWFFRLKRTFDWKMWTYVHFLNLANHTIQKGSSLCPRACCTLDGVFKPKGCSKLSDSGRVETTVNNPLAAPQLFHKVDLSLSNEWKRGRKFKFNFGIFPNLNGIIFPFNPGFSITVKLHLNQRPRPRPEVHKVVARPLSIAVPGAPSFSSIFITELQSFF